MCLVSWSALMKEVSYDSSLVGTSEGRNSFYVANQWCDRGFGLTRLLFAARLTRDLFSLSGDGFVVTWATMRTLCTFDPSLTGSHCPYVLYVNRCVWPSAVQSFLSVRFFVSHHVPAFQQSNGGRGKVVKCYNSKRSKAVASDMI